MYLKDFPRTYLLLNRAHRQRFPELRAGQHIRIRTAENIEFEGTITALTEDSVTIDNGGPVVGGQSAVLSFDWLEIIDLETP